MESKAKLLGHPIHPMLIPFPLGLLGTAVLFDPIALIGGDWESLARTAFSMIAAGIIGGLLAAVFGAIDWLAIPCVARYRPSPVGPRPSSSAAAVAAWSSALGMVSSSSWMARA